jgi:hypothetical protein
VSSADGSINVPSISGQSNEDEDMLLAAFESYLAQTAPKQRAAPAPRAPRRPRGEALRCRIPACGVPLDEARAYDRRTR